MLVQELLNLLWQLFSACFELYNNIIDIVLADFIPLYKSCVDWSMHVGVKFYIGFYLFYVIWCCILSIKLSC